MALAPVTSGITDIIRRETVAELSGVVPQLAGPFLAGAAVDLGSGRLFITSRRMRA